MLNATFSDYDYNITHAATTFDIPVVREDLTTESGTLDCTLQENKNNPDCFFAEDF